MAMTKKDYAVIAETLHDSLRHSPEHEQNVVRDVIYDVAIALKATYSNFNRDKFLTVAFNGRDR